MLQSDLLAQFFGPAGRDRTRGERFAVSAADRYTVLLAREIAQDRREPAPQGFVTARRMFERRDPGPLEQIIGAARIAGEFARERAQKARMGEQRFELRRQR